MIVEVETVQSMLVRRCVEVGIDAQAKRPVNDTQIARTILKLSILFAIDSRDVLC